MTDQNERTVAATTLVLARHGETEWNRAKRWQGVCGLPLNETGRRQAAELAKQLEGREIAAVYASDAERVLATAAPVAERLGLEIHVDERLREVDFGQWEGLARPEVERRFARELEAWDAFQPVAPPGGESDGELAERVLEALPDIAGRHAREQVLVVTSGGPVRAAQADVADVEQHRARVHFDGLDNSELVEIVVENRVLRSAS